MVQSIRLYDLKNSEHPDRRSSHPNQFPVSCPTYLYPYVPICVRCIVFGWYVCIPEHYHYSQTNTCLQSDTDNTEHKYINFGLFEDVTEVNITRTPWVSAPSIPIPDTTHPEKEPLSPDRTRHYRLPHPQSNPKQTREKTPIIRNHTKLRLSMLTKPSFHRVTKPTTTHLSHTG